MNDYRSRLKGMAKGEDREWFRIKNKANNVARIDIYDEIGMWGITAQDFVSQLNEIDAKKIELHINSPGGEVYDGIAIFNALKDHSASIDVTIDGLAASAASFIACAGDTVTMNSYAEVMVHDAWGMCVGNAEDMTTMANMLSRMSNNVASIYADKTGGGIDEWRAAMRDETWYTAEEAVAAGLADKVAENKKKTAATDPMNKFDLTVFNHAGRSDAPAPTNLVARDTAIEEIQNENDSVLTNGPEVSSMTPEQLKTLNLPEDATEDQVTEALNALVTASAEASTESTKSDTHVNDATKSESKTEESAAESAQASASLTEGTVTVDAEQFAEMKARLDDLAAKNAANDEANRIKARDELIKNCIGDGRIPPARAAHYSKAYDGDAEGTTELLNSLEKGLIPVTELGHAEDIQNSNAENAYPSEWSSSLVSREVQV